jgi:drug/metabolite transporter (DMT)-like permease
VSISGAAMIVVLSGSRPTFDLPGILLLFAAVLAGSAFNMVARRLATHFSSVEITFAMMATGVVFFGGAAAVDRLLAEDPAPLAVYLSEPMFLVSLAYLGVFSSVFAFVLLNLTVRRLGATRTASFANLTTVVSIAAGTIVLRESLSWYHFVGSGLILAGVWGANRKAGEAASPDAGPTPAALSEHPDRSDPGQSGSASSDR